MSGLPLKILTYNIHKGFSVGNRRFILHDIKEALRKVNADIVFLQEIQGEHLIRQQKINNWPDNGQFEFLADQIWDHHAYGKNAIYKQGHHGNAILSKYPFIEWENINVSPIRSASRSLLHGTIQIPDNKQKIHVICVHLGLFDVEREKQLSTLSQRINSHIPIDEPLIIAGDFNDWLGRAERHMKTDLDLYEVFKTTTGHHARSFPAWLPTLTMDRIYCRGLKPVECHRLHKMPWKKLSDHTPLLATFALS
ncbi:MAG: endonuclease/exonuclease/phosphatase family protein [Gammaproteobacteria bacterium]|nr:endonuclease/exonuclease/phosphatase family protein [Gammaproteobacteria bacterium]